MEAVKKKIRKVWLGHDDFEEGGFDYVASVIQEDCRHIREKHPGDEEKCIDELADTVINAVRMMMERGYDPESAVLSRLDDHASKGTDDIVRKYRHKYRGGG